MTPTDDLAPGVPPRRRRAAVPDAPDPALATDPGRYFNREQSWLDFNARVLALADDPSVPLLERAKFLAIYVSNLDEFYQVRVAGQKNQVYAGVDQTSHDGRTAGEQLLAIRDDVLALGVEQQRILLEEVLPGLAAEGIHLTDWADLDEDARK